MATEVTLYTRKDCHLCDEAKASIRAAVSLHRLAIDMREVDVDSDPDLRARYSDDVPVIAVNGVEAFRHRVRPEEFTAYVRGAVRAPSALAGETCVPCRGGVPPLTSEEIAPLLRELGNGWQVMNAHHLEKEFKFPDFAQALAFTNRVGAIAEEAGHHPDIYLGWGKVRITIWTHKIDGLSRSDFVLAAKLDQA
jgi:4a-hydroxytetrahydrobiopterin dehydratase